MPASWGKVSQGQPFAIVATDFGRAIMAAGLGIHESSLLWFVIERSWGESKKAGGRSKWPDPIPVKLDLRRLAEETGFVRQRMYEARSRLMAKNILIEQPEGVLINKNAETWIDPKTSKPLIPKEAIRYAKSSRPSPANLNAPAFNSERPSVQPRTPQRSNLNAPAFNSERPSVQPLIEERAAEDLRRFKRGSGRPAGTREDSQPDPEHEAAEADARTLFGDPFGDQVKTSSEDIRRHVRGEEATPFAAYRAALAEIHRRERKGSPSTNRHARALKIAQGFADHGLPAPEAPQAPKPTLKERIAAIEASEAESRERDA
jgi:hypothetical protein